VPNALSIKVEYIKGLICTISIPQYDWVEEEMIVWNQYEKA